MADFADWLQGEMTRSGLSVNELARRAEIDAGFLSRILSRERKPGAETYVALARGLQKPASVIFRAAGLLPELDDSDPTLEEANATLAELPPFARRQALAMIQFLYREFTQRGNTTDDSTAHMARSRP